MKSIERKRMLFVINTYNMEMMHDKHGQRTMDKVIVAFVEGHWKHKLTRKEMRIVEGMLLWYGEQSYLGML